MRTAARLLGFAFANADMLFEVEDRAMTVTFATGAVSEFVSGGELAGKNAASLFEPADGAQFTSLIRALPHGGRAGPVPLKLGDGRTCLLSVCRLPQNGTVISCTLSHPAHRQAGTSSVDPRTGLIGRDGLFEAAMAAGNGTALTLIDVPELSAACVQLAHDQLEGLLAGIGRVVRAAGSCAAAQVGPSTFAVIAAVDAPFRIGADILKVLTEGGLATAQIRQTWIELCGSELGSDQRFLALRHVVHRFADAKQQFRPRLDLPQAFDAMLADTRQQARHLTQTVLKDTFRLDFRPVANLQDGTIAYYEAVGHLQGADDGGAIAGFTDRLGLAEAFEIAVVSQIVSEFAERSDRELAVRISGRTVSTPRAFAMLAGLLVLPRKLSERIRIAITESGQIEDLAAAARAILTLRKLGFRVGLDDFGAGAACIRHLHGLPLDFVKFDGGLIHALGKGQREAALVTGLVRLCRELGIRTVADGIEDEADLANARACAFELGLGRHMGLPVEERNIVQRKTA